MRVIIWIQNIVHSAADGILTLHYYYYYYKWGSIGVLSNCWGPIKDTKRTRGRLDRNVAPCSRLTTNVIGPLHECKKVCPWMQECVSMNARKCVHECKKVCPWMQESVSMNARKCVHAQKPYPSQAFAHESSHVGGRGKWETEARRLMERKAKQKHIWGTKTRPAWAQIG